MAENFIPTPVQTFTNDTTAVGTVNNNFTAISTAFTDVLSRSGVSPNQMNSTLDMNSNQIINLPPPATSSSPARLVDIANGQITIVTATTGTSGHAVPFLDGNNTWSNTQNIALSSSLTPGLAISQSSMTGSPGSNFSANTVVMSENINAGAGFVNTLLVQDQFGGTSAFGGRSAVTGSVQLTSPTNSSNTNRYYAGVTGSAIGLGNDGGSGGNYFGELVGGAFTSAPGASSSNMFACLGIECNTSMATGSSAFFKALGAFSGAGADNVNGTSVDAMIWCYNHTGAVKWRSGIEFNNLAGQGQFPIASTGTVIKTVSAATVGTGIDFSSLSFNNFSILMPGFSVSPVGVITTGQGTIGTGSIIFAGITSGTTVVSTNSTGTGLSFSQPISIGIAGTSGGLITLNGQTSGSGTISVSGTGGILQFNSNTASIDSGGNVLTNGAIKVGQTVAPVSGGTASQAYYASSISGFGVYFGTGSPTITAAKGSLYLENGSGQLWINQSGTTTWTQITVP